MDWLIFFGVPFLIGLGVGALAKNALNRYEKRRALDKHIDDLWRYYDRDKEI